MHESAGFPVPRHRLAVFRATARNQRTPSARDVAVLDVNGDAVVDGSDVASLAAHLFRGGPPPAQGTECFAAVDSCAANQGCE